MARQAQEKVPEHIKFFIASRTFSSHGRYLACEFDVARSTGIHVDTFCRSFIGIHGDDMFCGLFASPAFNIRVSTLPEILIQIHKHLSAFWIRTGQGLQTVVTDGSSIASHLSPLLAH
jgi:hypothetical protein